jgi:hypothetical protein
MLTEDSGDPAIYFCNVAWSQASVPTSDTPHAPLVMRGEGPLVRQCVLTHARPPPLTPPHKGEEGGKHRRFNKDSFAATVEIPLPLVGRGKGWGSRPSG